MFDLSTKLKFGALAIQKNFKKNSGTIRGFPAASSEKRVLIFS